MSTFILRVAVEIVRHDCMYFVMLQVWFVACESMHVMRCLYLDQKLYSCLFFWGGGIFLDCANQTCTKMKHFHPVENFSGHFDMHQHMLLL